MVVCFGRRHQSREGSHADPLKPTPARKEDAMAQIRLNECFRCSAGGTVRDPAAPWWRVWQRVRCPVCKGSKRLPFTGKMPTPPPAPPRRKVL
jgi:hypothetical protein